MGLFGSKKRPRPVSAAGMHREPIQGKRKVSWDRAAHNRRPSNLESPFSGRLTADTLMSDPTRFQDEAHIRQMSGEHASGHTRQSSHQSDSTSRMIDADARALRVRKSDVLSSRPTLKFRPSVQYPAMPDGHLPTLKGQPASAFVDQIADELDTRQLRNVLETDSRRRRRRRSALENDRTHTRSHSTAPLSHARNGSSLAAPAFSKLNARAEEDPRREAHESTVETIQIAPISSRETRHPGSSGAKDFFTGISNDWHDPENIPPELPLVKQDFDEEPRILLAGNRDSFPDFAVVDRRGPVRTTSSSGFLTTAWGSLWRRASTARTKKEHDVAQHRTKVLQKANAADQITDQERRTNDMDHASENHIPSVTGIQLNGKKHFSSGSSVLYETLEGLSLGPTVDRDNNQAADLRVGSGDLVDEEVPVDAFYDPHGTPRTVTRMTHSRNFSRPTNDSRQGTYSRMSNQVTYWRENAQHEQVSEFSPLLNGGSFPRPDKRVEPAVPGSPIPSMTPRQAMAPNSPMMQSTQGFSTPVVTVANAGREPWTSPTLPRSPIVEHKDRLFPSTKLAYKKTDIATPPPTASRSPDRPSAGDSLSVQTPEADSWFDQHNSALDAVVRKSFSRKGDDRPRSSLGLHHGLTRPVSSRSQLRDVVTPENSDSGDGTDHHETRDQAQDSDRDSDEPLASPMEKELDDDVEYEQGIWRTGIGKPIHVIASPLRNGPVLIDRSQHVQAATPSRGNSQTRRSSEEERIRLSRTGSLGGEFEIYSSPPPRLMQNDSYMSSINSFHTADTFLHNASAATSVETLTDAHYI